MSRPRRMAPPTPSFQKRGREDWGTRPSTDVTVSGTFWRGGVVWERGTGAVARLVFTEEFREVLEEANKDNDERAGNADDEDPGGNGHGGLGQRDHKGIVNQPVAGGRQPVRLWDTSRSGRLLMCWAVVGAMDITGI